MVPPEPLLLLPASPVTVKLPVVVVSEIPFTPPFVEIEMNENVPPVEDNKTAVPVEVEIETSLTFTPVIAPAGSFIPVLVVELI